MAARGHGRRRRRRDALVPLGRGPAREAGAARPWARGCPPPAAGGRAAEPVGGAHPDRRGRIGAGTAHESAGAQRAPQSLSEEAEMSRTVWRHSVPSWRIASARSIQPGWVLGVILLLAMLLLEVWQQSAVASLALKAGAANDLRKRASNDLEWTR